jgi:hypothetical protein
VGVVPHRRSVVDRPNATLALGIYHRWEPGQAFVIVTTYGDESGTHDESPAMMLAGYVSTLVQWNNFDAEWKRDLLRSGLPGYFHATEHHNTAAGRRFSPKAARLLPIMQCLVMS